MNDVRTKNMAPDWAGRHGITELWSEIAPGLYVGGTADDDHTGLGQDYIDEPRVDWTGRRYQHFEINPAIITLDEFDAVVTLYAWARPVEWGVEELRWGIMDDRERAFNPDMVALLETVRWAHRRWQAGKNVLIRCQAGLNRSSLVAALVMVREGAEPQDAIDKIRRRRASNALFNRQFTRFITETDPETWRA